MEEAEKKPSIRVRIRRSTLRCVDEKPVTNYYREDQKTKFTHYFVETGFLQPKPPKIRKPRAPKKTKKKCKPKSAAQATAGMSSPSMSSSVRAKMASLEDIDKNYELNIAPAGPKYYGTDAKKWFLPATPAKRGGLSGGKRQIVSTPAVHDDAEEQNRPATYIEHRSYIEKDDKVAALDDNLVREVFPSGDVPEILSSPSISPEVSSPSNDVKSTKSQSGQESHHRSSKLASVLQLSDYEKPLQPPLSAEIMRLRSGRTINRSMQKKMNAQGEIVSFDGKSEQFSTSGSQVSKSEEKAEKRGSTDSLAAGLGSIAIEDNPQTRDDAEVKDEVGEKESLVEVWTEPHEEKTENEQNNSFDRTDVDLFGTPPNLLNDVIGENQEDSAKAASDEKATDGRVGATMTESVEADEDADDEGESSDAGGSEEEALEEEIDESHASDVVTESGASLEDTDSFVSADNNLHPCHLNKAMARLSMYPAMVSRKSVVFNFEREVYRSCGQVGPQSWDEAFPKRMIDECVKIGEGSYGEVFRSVNEEKASVVLKVIPIEGDFSYNGAPQMPFGEIFPEISISVSLSELRNSQHGNATPNFVEVQAIRCVKGRYPEKLLDAWNEFDALKGSENDPPTVFGDDQLFIVFIFGDGGCDLENVKLKSINQAKSIVEQLALTLAIAERELEFEHRDLHHGNVLVKDIAATELYYLIDGKLVEVKTHGVQVFIIDFTISRCINTGSGKTLYTDLARDPSLFEGEGDYQFEIYRKMRDMNGNEWHTFHPVTNIFWLDYIIDKLVAAKNYVANRKMTKKQAEAFSKLRRDLDDFDSCQELVFLHAFFDDLLST